MTIEEHSGTATRTLDPLAFLDSLWANGTPQTPDPVADHDKAPPRLWVVIARDVGNTWRVREVRAFTADLAAAKYNNIFDYEVVGVGLLGGSGHPVQWLRSGEWNE